MKQRRQPELLTSGGTAAEPAKVVKTPPVPLTESALKQVSGGVTVKISTPVKGW